MSFRGFTTKDDLLLKDEVYAIVGAAIEVHREFRNGYLEAVYQEAMEIELADRQIPFAAQAELRIRYKGRLLKKFYIADLVCYGQVLVELKVQEQLMARDEAQLLNYLRATGLRVGLLINFGDPSRLDWKRYVH
jgi:GxxExxY protein